MQESNSDAPRIRVLNRAVAASGEYLGHFLCLHLSFALFCFEKKQKLKGYASQSYTFSE